MQSTGLMPEYNEAFIASLILSGKAYIDTRDLSSESTAFFSKKLHDTEASDEFHLDAFFRARIVPTPKSTLLGASSSMSIVEYPKSNSLGELIDTLLQLECTDQVICYRKDKRIDMWVVLKQVNVIIQKRYCHLFAQKVDEIFDDDYSFSFRVLRLNSSELKMIPGEAKVFKDKGTRG